MGFKKFDGSAWQAITPKKLKGIPYSGTLPATITGTKAGYLHKYKIYGNTEQTGTPTPENPIEPSECGERTANLFDVSDYSVGTTSFVTKRITLEPNTTYTMSSNCPLYNVGALIVIGNVGESFTTAKNGVYPNHPISRTTDANGELVIGLRTNGSDYEPADYDTMLNLGSTALPYVPYGYKLPLTSAGQSVDIYLGESQTTRRIKKLVLTGGESWSYYSAANAPFRLNLTEEIRVPLSTIVFWICSHYEAVSNSASWASYDSCISWSTSDGRGGLRFRDIRYSNLDDFKAYIAQQYANGTPVTVWYVLATEETGTLNEPLRKIGNYADTIDSTQTTAQIPTAAGSTTISWAGEGLAPSQFDSIQEWVDIPTYTYTNGEWVADNSN